jgi:hypothetical protein
MYRQAGARAGHPAEKLKVGVHSPGFVANTTVQAADDFFPAYAHTFSQIGRERGWPPVTRAQFDAVRGPKGALLIGEPSAIVDKLLYENEVLGGIDRVTFLLTPGTIEHAKVMHAIELLGQHVAPTIEKELAGNEIVTGRKEDRSQETGVRSQETEVGVNPSSETVPKGDGYRSDPPPKIGQRII